MKKSGRNGGSRGDDSGRKIGRSAKSSYAVRVETRSGDTGPREEGVWKVERWE